MKIPTEFPVADCARKRTKEFRYGAGWLLAGPAIGGVQTFVYFLVPAVFAGNMYQY